MRLKYTFSVFQKCLRLKRRLFIIALIAMLVTLGYFNKLPHSLNIAVLNGKKTALQKDIIAASSTSRNALNNVDHWHDIHQQIISVLSETLKREKGRGCVPPKLDPFAPEMVVFLSSKVPDLDCQPRDWVKCHHEFCSVSPKTVSLYKNIECNYSKIIFKGDYNIRPSKEYVVLYGNSTYKLTDTDQVSVSCSGMHKEADVSLSYEGVQMGIRRELSERPAEPKSKYNILIIGFDSVSHNSVRRRMGHLYTALKYEFEAVILETYNIVGDGTPRALLPIFTGKTEPELPEVRKSKRKYGSNHTVDEYPFIFMMLRDLGYRTAYLEDMPWAGTWQMRMVGFKNQPADHYLRSLSIHSQYGKRYCHFGTPMHEVMFDLTEQIMTIDKKRKFVFTFSGDLTHDDINMVKHADEKVVNMLRRLRDGGLLNDTFVIVMGDHGSRYGTLRDTVQGKQEERMPLMSFIVPEVLRDARPDAYQNMKNNRKTLTTPFDIHSTLLDVLDLNEERVRTRVPGSDLPRSMSLLELIPPSRTCSEAGVEPHWCVCLEWIKLPSNDVFYKRVADFFVEHINMLTAKLRNKCALRSLTSVDYVSRLKPNDKLLRYANTGDMDGWGEQYGNATKYMTNYQIKLTVGPGVGIFEATLKYNNDTNKFTLDNRDISRVNAYNDEPKCIINVRPDLNMFCYCTSSGN